MSDSDKQDLKNKINQQAQQIGDPNASKSEKQADRSKIDSEAKKVEQGEPKSERSHESYHVMGEIRKGQMEHGDIFSKGGKTGDTDSGSHQGSSSSSSSH